MLNGDDNAEWNLTGSDDYEEISSEEVDRVVAALELLSETVESENIRDLLASAMREIHQLVYDYDEEAGGYSEAA